MSILFTKIHDSSNFIHPTAIVDDDVNMGLNNYIGPFCIIRNNVMIGSNNRFESHCCIGSLPEHKDYFNTGTSFGVRIGDENTFREFITINAGTIQNTLIGNNNILLRGSHFSHDSIMRDNCTLSCNVLIGGHSIILDGANMALGSICHQYSIIGHYSLVGMGGIVTKQNKIEPGNIYIGNPAKLLKYNIIGLKRNDISKEQLQLFQKEYKSLLK